MDYLHDVFISYRREASWTPWTRDIFKNLLRSYLLDELPERRGGPDIFVDERIEVGADWVDALGSHLAQSRVVVAILSGGYFGSDWCVHELDLILERAKACGQGAAGLVIPVVVQDGEHFPDAVNRLHSADLKKWRIAGLMKNTPACQELSQKIGELSPMIAGAARNAPAFDEKWLDHHKTRFSEVYNARIDKRDCPPTQFTLKTSTPPALPPRLMVGA